MCWGEASVHTRISNALSTYLTWCLHSAADDHVWLLVPQIAGRQEQLCYALLVRNAPPCNLVLQSKLWCGVRLGRRSLLQTDFKQKQIAIAKILGPVEGERSCKFCKVLLPSKAQSQAVSHWRSRSLTQGGMGLCSQEVVCFPK